MNLRHEFVEYIPETLDYGVLYVSVAFRTALHSCVCGCGETVVTPIGPTEWTLIYDGETVSLDPSIGNWSLSCRSHYWIERGRIRWSREFSQTEVERVRSEAKEYRRRYYSDRRLDESVGATPRSTLPSRFRRAILRVWKGTATQR